MNKRTSKQLNKFANKDKYHTGPSLALAELIYLSGTRNI